MTAKIPVEGLGVLQLASNGSGEVMVSDVLRDHATVEQLLFAVLVELRSLNNNLCDIKNFGTRQHDNR